LVIVRDADEALRIPLSKRLKVKLTQPMSDQLVLVEIVGFVKAALQIRSRNAAAVVAGGGATFPSTGAGAGGSIAATTPAAAVGAGAIGIENSTEPLPTNTGVVAAPSTGAGLDPIDQTSKRQRLGAEGGYVGGGGGGAIPLPQGLPVRDVPQGQYQVQAQPVLMQPQVQFVPGQLQQPQFQPQLQQPQLLQQNSQLQPQQPQQLQPQQPQLLPQNSQLQPQQPQPLQLNSALSVAGAGGRQPQYLYGGGAVSVSGQGVRVPDGQYQVQPIAGGVAPPPA
jgi:hypothetical protein